MNTIANIHSHMNIFPSIAPSQAIKVVSVIALATIAVLVLALSAWANVKVAAMYGASSLLKHSIYTTILPLAVFFFLVGAIVLLLYYKPRTQPQGQDLTQAQAPEVLPPLQEPLMEEKLIIEASEMQTHTFEEMSLGTLLESTYTISETLSKTVTAEWHGKIYLKCKVGDSVKKGDVIYEIECMKMIATYGARESGTIAEIFVKEGAIIETKDHILRLERAL